MSIYAQCLGSKYRLEPRGFFILSFFTFFSFYLFFFFFLFIFYSFLCLSFGLFFFYFYFVAFLYNPLGYFSSFSIFNDYTKFHYNNLERESTLHGMLSANLTYSCHWSELFKVLEHYISSNSVGDILIFSN